MSYSLDTLRDRFSDQVTQSMGTVVTYTTDEFLTQMDGWFEQYPDWYTDCDIRHGLYSLDELSFIWDAIDAAADDD